MLKDFHTNTPPKLIAAYRKAGSFHKLADELEINVKYIHELMRHGIEPTDRTETGRRIRKRLFLTKYRRQDKPRAPRQPQRSWRRWWRQLGSTGRDTYIQQLYDLNADEEE